MHPYLPSSAQKIPCLFLSFPIYLSKNMLSITQTLSQIKSQEFSGHLQKHFITTSSLTYITNGIQDFVKMLYQKLVDPLSYFSFQPVLHDWCNKGCGMCYPVCGMVHIKEPLLLIGKSSPCGSSGFPLAI